ncbi:MAG: 2-oxoglutarate dehydrogenase E1 subunit family protein, partial [Myxococcaceae bacterium]
MSNFQDSYLSGANIEFIEGLYARYLEDPNSVDPSWREVFARNDHGRPIFAPGERREPPAGAVVRPPIPTTASERNMELQAKVDQTIYAFRIRGHLVAQLDPLGRPRPSLDHVADTGMVNAQHFTREELETVVDSTLVFPENRVKLRDLLDRLRRTYCGSIGVEYMHVLDSDRRRWLGNRMEHSENRTDFTVDERKRLLAKLTSAEAFENFLHTKYRGIKRFALDGGESLIPMIDTMLTVGADLVLTEVVFAMAHRGRLNLVNSIRWESA